VRKASSGAAIILSYTTGIKAKFATSSNAIKNVGTVKTRGFQDKAKLCSNIFEEFDLTLVLVTVVRDLEPRTCRRTT
jgi:hypothetical protein